MSRGIDFWFRVQSNSEIGVCCILKSVFTVITRLPLSFPEDCKCASLQNDVLHVCSHKNDWMNAITQLKLLSEVNY